MQHPILTIALRAVRKAGNTIAKYYEELNTLSSVNNTCQKSSNKFKLNINKVAEKIILEIIRKSYPQHTIISKISGEHTGINQDIKWIIDPLDGTNNFIKCLPLFSISIAVKIKNLTEVGVVYDPIRNELFTAIRGHGAQLNGYCLRISSAHDINSITLATGFPFKAKEYSTIYMNILSKLFTKSINFRIIGSTALNLAYLAAGRVDGYFEIALKPWNFVAGELIAREAGALICDFSGGHNYILTGNLVVGNPKVVRAILTNVRNELTEILKS